MTDIVNAKTGRHPKTVAEIYGEFRIEALCRKFAKIPRVELESLRRTPEKKSILAENVTAEHLRWAT
jgi:hypothetical protein